MIREEPELRPCRVINIRKASIRPLLMGICLLLMSPICYKFNSRAAGWFYLFKWFLSPSKWKLGRVYSIFILKSNFCHNSANSWKIFCVIFQVTVHRRKILEKLIIWHALVRIRKCEILKQVCGNFELRCLDW